MIRSFYAASRNKFPLVSKRAFSFSFFDWISPGENNLAIQLQSSFASNKNKDSESAGAINFQGIKPTHVDSAAKTVHEICDAAGKQLSEAVESNAHVGRIIQAYDASEAPLYCLKQMVLLFSELSEPERKAAWQQSLNEVSKINRELDPTVMSKLRKALEGDLSDLNADCRWALKNLVHRFDHISGQQIPAEQRQKYEQLGKFHSEVTSRLLETQKFTLASVGDMYNYLGVRTEQAQMRGFANVAEMLLSTRQFDLDHVLGFQSKFSNRIVTVLNDEIKVQSKDEMQLHEYLGVRSNKASAKPKEMPPEMKDLVEQLRLERLVTLDGALQFAFRLCQDLFDVLIEEDKNASGWHKDVRLFHVRDASDSSHCHGSFFLDPYSRRGKLSTTFTMPMLTRTSSRAPLACMSLQIEPPSWDTDPTPMTWEDTETFLYELGHVLQLLLVPSPLGLTVGAQNLDSDFSELLPKFMESWLFEKATVYSMIYASGSELPSDDLALAAAFRVRSREKVLELAEQNYLTALELKLFTDFDLKGDESMLMLQNRLASELVPHDLPDKKDGTPLLRIFRQNANGRQICLYRNMLGDLHAASLFEYFKAAHLNHDSNLTTELRQYLRKMVQSGPAVDATSLKNELQLQEDPSKYFERLTFK